MNRVGPNSNSMKRVVTSANPSGGEHSDEHEHLEGISEKNSRSNSEDSLKNPNRNITRRSPDPADLGGNQHDPTKTYNLVEIFDILPTAFLLTPTMASEMNRFKKCFSDLHIGKGLSMYESVPEKHCKNN
jgi:hypothetical protein